MILALTSATAPPGKLYDMASTILQQKLAQLEGVGQVFVGGSSLPAVRVELNPHALARYGIGLEDVRAMLATANVNRPKGQIHGPERAWEIRTSDQIRYAAEYRPLLVAWRNGAAVHLEDVADVRDSVEDLRSIGLANGQRAALLIIFRQPGANVIDTVDRIRDAQDELHALLPADVTLTPVLDQTVTIRASVADVEHALMISVALVVLVVFLLFAIFVSLVVSLTATRMMCARLLRSHDGTPRGRLYRAGERVFGWVTSGYEKSLGWALNYPRTVLLIAGLTCALNVYLFMVVPKGFFPQQDNGRLNGSIVAAQDTSFQAMRDKVTRYAEIVRGDPAVATVTAYTGGGARGTTVNTARMFIALKPRPERDVTADQVITPLRPKLARVPGATCYPPAGAAHPAGRAQGNR